MSATSVSLPSASTEKTFDSLADVLLNAAKSHPTSGVRIASQDHHETEIFTYPSLLDEAQCLLSGLRTCGLGPKAKVALLLERPRDFIPAFWACILGGYVPCPLTRTGSDPERWAKHVSHVDTLLNRPLFISTHESLMDLPTSVNSACLDDLRASSRYERVQRASQSDPAVLMLTSGSTGNSKAVELTHRNILASMIAKRNRHHWSSADVAFNWVGFDHVAALLEAHTTAASVGAMQVHIEPAKVLADPLLFLRIIDRYRVSVTFAPNFLLGQINSALQSTDVALHTRNGAPPDLSCLRRILTGGEANVVQTGLRFLELLKPYGLSRDALCPIYGLTETCAAVVYSLEFPMLDANREFATVGLPVDGLEMRITDEDGHSLPDRESGEVQVRGPIVFSRYYKNEEATQAAFTADGWFRTGDLGRIDDERLSIVARIKDTIIVSGVNYFSHELETQLQQLDGIERSFLAAFPIRPKGADTEQLVVAFATPVPATVEERIYQLLVAVRNTAIMLWGFRPTFVLPLPMSAFPKTSLGKIQRSLMRKRFEAGTYNAELASVADITARQLGGHTAPKSQTESGVAEIYAAILGIGPSALSTTASFFDLGGTSLDILKLTHALEIRFGVKASLPIIVQNPTVCQLAARILSGSPIAGATYDPVVPLQTTGRKTPLFCVHPGNSEVLVLVNLAKYFLNDRPFYAFRPPGFNTGEACFERLEDFVNSYANAVIERQPQGPYAIAGYSMGAGIAFEIAKELETRGHTVGFLGLIDYVPNFVPISVQFVEIATAVAWVLELIDAKQCERLRAEIPDAPATLETSEYILRFASRTRVAQLDLDSTKFLTWSRVAHVTEDVMYQHATIGKVSSMTIFCSDGIAGLALGDDWRKRLRRWGEFSLQPAKFVDVPGDHYTLMMPKNVASFQALFRAEIETALHKHEVS